MVKTYMGARCGVVPVRIRSAPKYPSALHPTITARRKIVCIAPATVDLGAGRCASERVSESVAKLAPRVKGVDVTETISALRKQERIFQSSDNNTAPRHQRFRSGIYPEPPPTA